MDLDEFTKFNCTDSSCRTHYNLKRAFKYGGYTGNNVPKTLKWINDTGLNVIKTLKMVPQRNVSASTVSFLNAMGAPKKNDQNRQNENLPCHL